MSVPVRHYVNLGTGIEHLPQLLRAEPARGEIRFCRLQSTALEQSLWGDFVRDAGADLVMSIALGYECRVYDAGSRRGPASRALWQGLPWLRFALGAAWMLPERGTFRTPNGDCMSGVFGVAYSELSKPIKTWLKYFKPFVKTPKVRVVGVEMPSQLDGKYGALAEILWKEMT